MPDNPPSPNPASQARAGAATGNAVASTVESAGNVVQGINNTQVINPQTAFNTLILQDPGSKFPLDLDIFSSKTRSWELADHPQQVDEFLSQVENLIRTELTKARDEHFVELSMRMAQPGGYASSDIYQQSYRMTFGEVHGIETITDLKDLLKLLNREPLVLLGIPGSGKSTILHHLALLMIGSYRKKESALLPCFVRLTEYTLTQDGKVPPILKFLQAQTEKLVGKEHFIAQNFEQLVHHNRFCFILDGLDQMPERRSETVRLGQRKKVENQLRRMDRALKMVRVFQMKKLASRLLATQQEITSEAAPTIDPRESEIARLPRLNSNCVAVTSCRQHDFIGVPQWQTLSILPMDDKQVREFIRCYAPGAEEIIAVQAAASESTRSLITNPFYLRMVTQAAKLGLQASMHAADFKKVLSRRGRFLEYLVREAIFASLKRNSDGGTVAQLQQKAAQTLASLGALAYYMLERNIIGSIPRDALERLLGEEINVVMQAAEDANLITIHERDGGIEFNHQLFLEFLLAFDLRQKGAESGRFEEALLLLSHRGDRWAETIRLLFEMSTESHAEDLIQKFVDALSGTDTWDISTRVLADLGPRVAPYVAPLLRQTDELKVTGAAKVLGKIKATAHAALLVSLNNSQSWRVRRAAVEALAAMGLSDQLQAFDGDRHSGVLRSLFRARLQLDQAPSERIQNELNGGSTIRSEQMAFAVLDLFSNLLVRLDQQVMLDLLRSLIVHKNHDICVLGVLILAQAPDYFKRRLKQEILRAALEDDDSVVNVMARRAVSPFLDVQDIAMLKKMAPDPTKLLEPFQRHNPKALRAYWLLLDSRELVSPLEYLKSISCAPQGEIQLLTRKLRHRADSTALSFLTFLLEDQRTARQAMEALVALKGLGVAYLIEALNDPSPEIRLNVAKLLQDCYLPLKYARQVRANLRKAGIKTHEVTPFLPNVPVAEIPVVFISALTTLMFFIAPVGMWVISKIFGAGTSLGYWISYALSSGPTPFTVDNNAQFWTNHAVEELAFGELTALRDSDFWLARGRIERALNRTVEAKDSFKTSLDINPESTVARLELALMKRALSNNESALETVEADNKRYLETSSDLFALQELLLAEEQPPAERSLATKTRIMHLLDRLRLWSESRNAALSLLQDDPQLSDAYRVLFCAYRGLSQPRRALAAARAYNASATASDKIREIELEDLSWQHRSDTFFVQMGDFQMALDLGKLHAARQTLQVLGILPPPGQELSEDQTYAVQTLSADVRDDVLALLKNIGETGPLQTIIYSMPVQSQLRGEGR